MTKEAKIYKGEWTVSSLSGARQTGQLHLKKKIRTLGQGHLKTKRKMLWRRDHNQQEWVPGVEKETQA